MDTTQQQQEHRKLAKWGETMAKFWSDLAKHHAAKAEDPEQCLTIPQKPAPPDGVTIKIYYHAE